MKTIDFLPSRYREQSNQRRVKLWQFLVLALFGAGIGATAFAQYTFRRAARRQLAAIDEQHSLARARTEQFNLLQQQLKDAQATTQLYAWLHHPWPRTQILAAVAEKLPNSLTLSEVRLAREATPSAANDLHNDARRPRRARREETEEEAKEKLPAAVRDLQRLRDEYDTGRTVVEVSGLAGEIAALHTYLAHLSDVPLFTKCELASLEAVGETKPGTGSKQSRFKIRLVVRPGYGQPGSPAPSQERAAVAARE